MFVYRSCQCVQIIHSTLVAWLAQKEKERSGDRLGSANDRAAMIDILRQFVGYIILLGLLPDPNQVIHIFRRLVKDGGGVVWVLSGEAAEGGSKQTGRWW